MIASLLQSPSFIIHTRQIRWLCHFTPRKNLASIKANGLLTRSQLDVSENVHGIVTDLVRYDQTGASCLSISKPNKWMFKKKQEQGMDLCLILIDISVLYVKHCLFYPHNAASTSYRNIPMSNFQGYLALNAMFASEITYQK